MKELRKKDETYGIWIQTSDGKPVRRTMNAKPGSELEKLIDNLNIRHVISDIEAEAK